MAIVITPSAEKFSRLDGNALVDIPTTCAVIGKSRNSVYRLFQSGDLEPIKIGHSTRIRVADIRRLIGSK
jgi:predicted DNA-binding transcriptional regulator AlpA